MSCLLESGCEVTLIPETVVEAARNLEVLPSSQRLWAANGTKIGISGEATFPLMLDGKCIWTTALVSPDVEEVMLGSGWLQDHNCVWDFRHSRVFIDGRAAVTLARKGRLCCRRIFVQEDAVMPPRQQVDVTTRSTLFSPRNVGSDWIVDNHQVRPERYVGRTLVPAAHHDLKVCMVNTTAIPVGTCLGNLQPVVVVKEPVQPRASSSDDKAPAADVLNCLMEKLLEDMTGDQRQQV